jgi:hypothetical protein
MRLLPYRAGRTTETYVFELKALRLSDAESVLRVALILIILIALAVLPIAPIVPTLILA